jgi:hypothetical protein
MSEPTAYELYRSGVDLLEQHDHHAAALPLRRARDLEPTTAMVREALGRALQLQGLHAEARPPLTMAALLQPERADYRVYRDRTIAAIENGEPGDDGVAPMDPETGGPTPSGTGDAPSRPGSRRSGEGPWGAPAVDVPAREDAAGGLGPSDGPTPTGTDDGAGQADDGQGPPEDLGGPPPRA